MHSLFWVMDFEHFWSIERAESQSEMAQVTTPLDGNIENYLLRKYLKNLIEIPMRYLFIRKMFLKLSWTHESCNFDCIAEQNLLKLYFFTGYFKDIRYDSYPALFKIMKGSGQNQMDESSDGISYGMSHTVNVYWKRIWLGRCWWW